MNRKNRSKYIHVHVYIHTTLYERQYIGENRIGNEIVNFFCSQRANKQSVYVYIVYIIVFHPVI